MQKCVWFWKAEATEIHESQPVYVSFIDRAIQQQCHSPQRPLSIYGKVLEIRMRFLLNAMQKFE